MRQTITAPGKSSYSQSGHYYDVTVRATDDANNTSTADASHSTLGSSLQLRVKERVAPVLAIIYPTASALITNNKPSITWTVTDDDSGVNPSTIGVTIVLEARSQGIVFLRLLFPVAINVLFPVNNIPDTRK